MHHFSAAPWVLMLDTERLLWYCVQRFCMTEWFPHPLSLMKVSTSSMALVVMCGQPCSGKSAAAACLAAALRSSSPDLTVRIIDELSLHLGRNDSYKGNKVLVILTCLS